MESQGQVGQTPIQYDVVLDDQLSLKLSLNYKDASGAYVKIEGGASLASVLDQAMVKLNNPLATQVEQMLVSAIKLYLAQQPQAAPKA